MNDGGSTSGQQDDPSQMLLSNATEPLPQAESSSAEQDLTSGQIDHSRTRRTRLRHLLIQLDGALYILLGSTYYLDCMTILFLVRVLIQFTYLSPKPADLPLPRPSSYCSPIILSNFMCIILHTFLRAPVGPEATRGYLHGSLFIDFIGQKGPTSKARLVLHDLMILSIQLLCFVVVAAERQEAEKSKKLVRSSQGQRSRRTQWVQELLTGASRRTSTAENNNSSAQEDGIELDDLSRGDRAAPTDEGAGTSATGDDEVGDRHSESTGLLTSRASDEDTTAMIEQYASGQVMLADFHIWDAIQNDLYEARNLARSRGRL